MHYELINLQNSKIQKEKCKKRIYRDGDGDGKENADALFTSCILVLPRAD
jgi:hypothetical protein